jgi:hypothetical protein
MSGINGTKYTGPDTDAIHQEEMQNLGLIINQLMLAPVINAGKILTTIFSVASDELIIHRSFEVKLRDGTVSEEALQLYLDSLVAFRQRIAVRFQQQQETKTTQPSVGS